MAGPGKKPPQLKVISGTDRKDRAAPAVAVEMPALEQVPEPPDWLLNAHAVNEWKRLAPLLVKNKLLTEAGQSALGVLCSLHGELQRQLSVGIMPTAHLVAQYRAMSNDFGLTPMSQGKVRPSGEAEKPGGKFGGIGKKPTAPRR